MSRSDLANTTCSVGRAIERVGDPWTLMILREIFLGSRRFDEFQRYTGASPHSLSQRLKQLCADEILQKRQYSDHPPRFEYHLTQKGRDLWPVIIALKTWGDTWMDVDRPVDLVHTGCGQVVTPQMTCPDCGERIEARHCRPQVGPELAAERQKLANRPDTAERRRSQ